MRRALAILILSCSHNEPPPAKVGSAPISDTAPIPTSSAPAETTPAGATQSTATAAKPPPTATSTPKSTGALAPAECDKVIHKFAELVAQGQNAELLGGFESTPIYIGMRDQCTKETTRKQYDCAMSAKTHQAWQECMK